MLCEESIVVTNDRGKKMSLDLLFGRGLRLTDHSRIRGWLEVKDSDKFISDIETILPASSVESLVTSEATKWHTASSGHVATISIFKNSDGSFEMRIYFGHPPYFIEANNASPSLILVLSKKALIEIVRLYYLAEEWLKKELDETQDTA